MTQEPALQWRRGGGAAAWAVAAITGFMGGGMLFVTCALADAPGADAPAWLPLAALVLLAVAGVALGFRQGLRIEPGSGRIDAWWSVGPFTRRERHRLARFRGVGVGSYARASQRHARVGYLVQLTGDEELRIPWSTGRVEEARSLARRLGERLGLPVDEEPRAVVSLRPF